MKALIALALLFTLGLVGQQTEGTVTLTGVVDQRNGEWILATEENVEQVAILRAQGFKDTNFAKFVGNTVRVKGRMKSENGKRTLTVVRLADIEQVEPAKK